MKLLSDSVTRNLATKVLKLKKNSPHIFFGAGVAGVVGSTVLACRATLKLEDTLDEIREDVNETKERGERARVSGDSYFYQDYKKDLAFDYLRATKKLGKLYGPSVGLGLVSIAALTGSHVEMARRNTALTAAVATVTKAFDEYRQRVAEQFGDDAEKDIYNGFKEETVATKDGPKTFKVRREGHLSDYARLFEESNVNWQRDSELNYMFVKAVQEHQNVRLRTRGHVFLNEVYDALGIEHTKAGSVVGWYYDENGDGDNYINFGLQENYVEGERNIWLDFNVDGVIFDLIPE